MPRIVALLFAFLGLAAASPALAEDYVDGPNGFRLTIPEGWERIRPGQPLDLVLMSPRIKTSGGACMVISEEYPQTQTMSQDEINESLQSEINEAFWQALAKEARIGEVEVVETGSELKDGRRSFFAVLRFTVNASGQVTQGQFRMAIHAIPGRMAANNCAVRVEQLALEEADIKLIMDSFTPMRSHVVAALPLQRPATLVLHSGPRFDGHRRELTHDVPDMAQVGWTGWTASLNTKGYGLWEICDGANYRGNCRLVAGAESAVMGERALRIGSARRVFNIRDPRSGLGAVADMLTAAAQQGAHGLAGRR
jgi:hypothetical protein